MFDFIEDPELRQKAEDEFNEALNKTNASIDAKIAEATDGLKKSQQKLLDEKKKLQDKYKDITDPEEALRALQLISGNEEVKLLAEGKFDEVVQRRVSAHTKQYEDQVAELQSKFDNADMSSTKYKSMYNDLVVDHALRQAALQAGVLPAALDDVLNKGRRMFALNEDEVTVESRDKNGKLRKTDDDKVLTPDNWIEGLKRTAPHYWPASRSAHFIPGGGDADDLDVQIAAAAKAGNQPLYRELREKQKKARG